MYVREIGFLGMNDYTFLNIICLQFISFNSSFFIIGRQNIKYHIFILYEALNNDRVITTDATLLIRGLKAP